MRHLKSNLFTLLFFLNLGVYYSELNLKDFKSPIEWNIIQEGDMEIKWTNYQGFPICKVSSSLPYSIEPIAKIIEDVEHYPKVFRRIHEVKILGENTVHIMLDMPFLLADRDYVIKHKKSRKDSEWEFSFVSGNHKNAPLNKNYIRLINAAGKWELSPKNQNETLLSYTWNGELLGDFPDFALQRAWKTQGNEIIQWITYALK